MLCDSVIEGIFALIQEKTMIATLQGGIASKSETQIYILSPSEPDYEIWLKSFYSNRIA